MGPDPSLGREGLFTSSFRDVCHNVSDKDGSARPSRIFYVIGRSVKTPGRLRSQ